MVSWGTTGKTGIFGRWPTITLEFGSVGPTIVYYMGKTTAKSKKKEMKVEVTSLRIN